MPDEVDNKSQADKSEQLAKVKSKWPKWKIVLILLVVFVVVPFVTWLIANYAMDAKLETQFEKYRVAGQPVQYSDFNSPFVPDYENATLLQLEAIEKIPDGYFIRDEYFKTPGIYLGYPRSVADERMEKIFSGSAPAIELIIKSRSFTKYSLGYKPRFCGDSLNDGERLLDLDRFVRLLAHRAIINGDDVAAIQYLADSERILLSLRTAVNGNRFFYFSDHEITIPSAYAAQYILARIKTVGLSRAQSAAIVKELEMFKQLFLAENDYRNAVEKAIWMSRLDLMQRANGLGVGLSRDFESWSSAAGLVLLPFAKKYALSKIDDCSVAADAVAKDDFTVMLRQYLLLMAEEDRVELAKYTGTYSPKFDERIQDVIRQYCNSKGLDFRSTFAFYSLPPLGLSCRRMMAVAIAMKQYEIENSKPAAALVDLVPKYLPEIPVDPYSPIRNKVKLAIYKGLRMLYCVGRDQIDNGGLPDRGKNIYSSPDVPFCLDVWPGP